MKKWGKRLFKLIFVIFIVGFIFSAILYYTGNDVSEFSKNKIVVIDLQDVIYESDTIINKLKKYNKNEKVKGFILRVNSPGGGVAPSQEIYRYIKNLDKPVFVAMQSLAASGGYYVSIAADKIYALPGTITGSIGVIIKFPNMKGLYEKIGIDFQTIKSGKFKDIGSPNREMTKEEIKLLQDSIMEVYNQFVSDILSSRKIKKETLLDYADGRIIVGSVAKKIGLIDELGTYLDAFEDMKKHYNIPDAELYFDTNKDNLLERLTETATYFRNKMENKNYLYYLFEG
ncbi:signal peptide peptidase SppA [Deferribacterales bacterium Es71-Z0220]|uniref:signal peptide peptidase SppA n=1 Tax=Deferrivibrio essentukiensis TaxID=2880922 RepID=UPI001F617C3F|nr:signal peptide peptidase SppA [Deferrivibrio essentukiensis]MCB4203659.1 signal peptide peptidase SppA [Deferrivibrio essentukiensis]